jgi:hypothetical protein
MAQGFWQTLATLQVPGTALTAAARASMTQGANATAARYTLPGNYIKTAGDMLRVEARGIISCVITTPGTARFDLNFGGTALFDTQAMPLNTVARTSVTWSLELVATCTVPGATSSWVWDGIFLSEAFVGTALQSSVTGPGPGGTKVPWSGTATGASNVVSASSFNTTVSNLLDLDFTQTVATGSVTLQQYSLSLLTSTGF